MRGGGASVLSLTWTDFVFYYRPDTEAEMIITPEEELVVTRQLEHRTGTG